MVFIWLSNFSSLWVHLEQEIGPQWAESVYISIEEKKISLPPIAMEKFTPMCREGNNEPKYIISWSSFCQPWSEFTWKFYCNSAIHFCWWQAPIGLSQNRNHHRFLRREFRWTSGVCHNMWTAFFSCLIIVDHSDDFYRNIWIFWNKDQNIWYKYNTVMILMVTTLKFFKSIKFWKYYIKSRLINMMSVKDSKLVSILKSKAYWISNIFFSKDRDRLNIQIIIIIIII